MKTAGFKGRASKSTGRSQKKICGHRKKINMLEKKKKKKNRKYDKVKIFFFSLQTHMI